MISGKIIKMRVLKTQLKMELFYGSIREAER